MASLPIFSTSAGREADIDIDRLSRQVLGGRDFVATSRAGTTSVQGPDITLDVDRARGGMWAGDTARLWSAEKVTVPAAAAVRQIAVEAPLDVVAKLRILCDLPRLRPRQTRHRPVIRCCNDH